MQIVPLGDNLHEISKLFSGENKKNISICRLLIILPRMLRVNLKMSNHLILEYFN